MDKEKWIDRIIQSAGTIQPVASNPFLHTRIEARLQQSEPSKKIPLPWIAASALVMAILLWVNVSAWQNTAKQPGLNGLQEWVQELGWNTQNPYSLNY